MLKALARPLQGSHQKELRGYSGFSKGEMENRDKEMTLQTLVINPAREVWASAGQVLTLLQPPPPGLQPAPTAVQRAGPGPHGHGAPPGSPVRV